MRNISQANVKLQKTSKPVKLRALPPLRHAQATSWDVSTCEGLLPASPEASREAMAAQRVSHESQKQLLGRRATGKNNQKADALGVYMEGLTHIPLFSPEEENEAAQNLETLEAGVWMEVLWSVQGVHYTILELSEGDMSLTKLLQGWRRGLKNPLSQKSQNRRRTRCYEIALALRQSDADNVKLDGIMVRLRRDAKGPRTQDENGCCLMNEDDLQRLHTKRRLANEARNNFTRANLRLVVSVARGFNNRFMQLVDLVQEGNVGLMKAIHRFDHRRGYRFSTYAHWWIRQSIERAIVNKGHQVRLPVHILDSRRQLERARRNLHREYGREPETSELMRRTQMSADKIEDVDRYVQRDPTSLEETRGNDQGWRLMDVLPDQSVPDTDTPVMQKNLQDKLHELLKLLSPMEKDILQRRFGLEKGEDQTLEQVGKAYNLSRERVRQIQVQGLTKMRRMCERRQIEIYDQ
jgi:RNA polymerase primary sigma factor